MSHVSNEVRTLPALPDGAVNWDAFSHDELYQMLWQEADVADVSAVATEWAQHRTALTTHAEVLREQRAALSESWRGAGAEEAAARLDTLAARVAKIAEFARAGEVAAQEGADALAMARATMPPPSNSTAPLTDAVAPIGTAPPGYALPKVPDASSLSSMDSYLDSMGSYVDSMNSSLDASTSPMTSPMDAMTSAGSAPPSIPAAAPNWTPTWAPAAPTTIPSSVGSDPGTALGAVGGSGFSFYSGSVSAEAQKAEAVRTMRAYESSLTRGSQLIGTARGAVPAAAPSPAAVTPEQPGGVGAPSTTGSSGAGVPWRRLVGGGGAGSSSGSGGGAPGVVRGAPAGPGARLGVAPGMTGVAGMAGARLAAEATAARSLGAGGMVPPVGGVRGTNDEKHENHLPTVDRQLFAVDEPHSRAVIGLLEGER